MVRKGECPPRATRSLPPVLFRGKRSLVMSYLEEEK